MDGTLHIGICYDGDWYYKCKGTGTLYKDFYEWIRTLKSYKCIYVDFPWDFFQIIDNAEKSEFVNKYGYYMYKDYAGVT